MAILAMTTWDESTQATEWVDIVIDRVRNSDSSSLAPALLEIQNEFMGMQPKAKATAFIYLLGKVVRDEI